jgi:putative ABC transport system permease protein
MKPLMSLLRSYWNGLRKPSELDANMADEMRFHIDMEAERLMKTRGLDADEARRQAAIAFGGVEKYRGAGRDALGFSWARGMSTDIKLGVRMLRKYPGLTAVALFALSLAIGAGAAYLEFVNDLLHGKLPFPHADRIVGIINWDRQSGVPENRATFDYVAWKDTLAGLDEIGAYRDFNRNLVTGDGHAEPVRGAEISASAFRLAGMPPVLGRPLIDDDERAAAAPAVVLGYDVWVNRLGSDPLVIGQTVRIGNVAHTIVGIMPAGFGFPIAHSAWVALKLNDGNYPRRDGAPIKIFGRLAPGVGLDAAQSELTAVSQRIAADYPDTHRYLNPVMDDYVTSLWSSQQENRLQRIIMYAANLFFIGLLALCGANIATLVFARTASRDVEISVRTALGASRARIAGQLFAEALVLSSIAAAIGLLIAAIGLQWVRHTITVAQGSRLMFWWDDRLSIEAYVYAAILALGAALMVGVVPALKATGPKVQERLKHATGGSAAGLRFGGVWTGVIVTQVGVTMIFLAVAGIMTWGIYFGNSGDRERNYPASQYVGVRLTLDGDPSALGTDGTIDEERFRARLRTLHREFAERLTAEPGVSAVTYTSHFPGTNLQETQVEVEAEDPAADQARYVQTSDVALNFFDAFQSPIVAGRAFSAADLAPDQHVAIVDQTFVRQVLGGREAIGRRIRRPAGNREAAGPWVEIVGVVRDLTVDVGKGVYDSVVYRPAAADSVHPIRIAVHAANNPTAMVSRVRVIASEVDPSMRLDGLMTLDKMGAVDRVALHFFLRLLAGIGGVALVLATAGVYALMSFTVTRRTSEIGIRLALGANPRRIMVSTFGRALLQIMAGLVAGGIPAVALAANLAPEIAVGGGPRLAIGVCAGVAIFMAGVTALACFFPARRALKIQPVETLKAT